MDKKDRKRQYNKETYEWLKEHNLCTKCKKQAAYTLNGRVLCYECSYKNNDRFKKSYQNKKTQMRIRCNEEYAYYKQQGICPICRKRPAPKGHTLCSVCLGKRKKRYDKNKVKSYAREDAIADGLCRTCLKENVKPGYKVCEKCYENLSIAQEKADRSYLRKSNHWFFIKHY